MVNLSSAALLSGFGRLLPALLCVFGQAAIAARDAHDLLVVTTDSEVIAKQFPQWLSFSSNPASLAERLLLGSSADPIRLPTLAENLLPVGESDPMRGLILHAGRFEVVRNAENRAPPRAASVCTSALLSPMILVLAGHCVARPRLDEEASRFSAAVAFMPKKDDSQSVGILGICGSVTGKRVDVALCVFAEALRRTAPDDPLPVFPRLVGEAPDPKHAGESHLYALEGCGVRGLPGTAAGDWQDQPNGVDVTRRFRVRGVSKLCPGDSGGVVVAWSTDRQASPSDVDARTDTPRKPLARIEGVVQDLRAPRLASVVSFTAQETRDGLCGISQDLAMLLGRATSPPFPGMRRAMVDFGSTALRCTFIGPAGQGRSNQSPRR